MSDYPIGTSSLSWSVEQLRFYRKMYYFMGHHQEDFTKPFTCHIPDADWIVISRLAALYATHNMVEGPSGTTLPAELE